MANPSPPSQSSILLFFLLLLLTSVAKGVGSATKSQEFSSMLEALRHHGYTLFFNAITTSDLQYQLLTTSTAAAANPDQLSPFTLFAPRDELLFALDMAADAAVYVSTLRYHVIPNHRHTFSDLQNLSSSFLDTLLPHYAVLIGKIHDGATVGVMVDGVRVSVPDLFLGSRIAVHGIDGILLTGLNMNQDLGGNDNGSGISPPVESPAPGIARNSPAEGSHAPMSQFDWSINVSPPPCNMHGNIPAEGSLSPTSHLDRDNVPVAGAPALDGNIPVKGTVNTPPSHEFDRDIVPGGLDGNIPVAASPKILQDEKKKMKSSGKKKRGKRHRRGHRKGHRKHREVSDHGLSGEL